MSLPLLLEPEIAAITTEAQSWAYTLISRIETFFYSTSSLARPWILLR